MSDFTNKDGLTRHYGPQTPRDKAYQVVRVGGGISQLVVDFSFDDLPGFDADAGGGSTPDSFSEAIPYIPAGATILDATFLVCDAFAGGTSYAVGTYTKAGAAIDADGIFTGTALALANINADGKVVSPDGVDVVKTSGTFDGAAVSTTENAYLVVAATGTFTDGQARMVLTYMEKNTL